MQKIAAVAGLIFLTGCDCVQIARGVARDVASDQPLDGVRVSVVSRNKLYYTHVTDSIGRFEFSVRSGGIIGCPAITLQLEKPGYKVKRVKVKQLGAKAYALERAP